MALGHTQPTTLNRTEMKEFSLFSRNDLKLFPGNTYNSDLKEFPCSYSKNERYRSQGVILASEHTKPPTLNMTELKEFLLTSHQ
jgi:hypothetical protein